jgi:hypothetical protein
MSSHLAEERKVSRAATRLLLSQSAVSRALQRMRDTFHDDLLVRTAKGYEPTPQGERVLQELEIMLPKLDRLISGSAFDRTPTIRRFGGGKSQYQGAEGAGGDNRLQVPDDLASASQYRCRAYMASRRDQENWQEGRLMIFLTTESDCATVTPQAVSESQASRK